jgi:hypothetical protein
MGGLVPKSYYFSCNKPEIGNKKSLSIPRGSKEQLEFQVKEASTVLKYKCLFFYFNKAKLHI